MATVASQAIAEKKKWHFEPFLDPLERFSEILFGVIMVLTFTVSLRVARADRLQVHEMLIGALSCNLAWGVNAGTALKSSSGFTRPEDRNKPTRSSSASFLRLLLRSFPL